MSKMKPTLEEVIRDTSLLDSMTLGDMLALAGLDIEVEHIGADEAENEQITDLVKHFVPDHKKQ